MHSTFLCLLFFLFESFYSYTQTFIRINQIGYDVQDIKQAIVFSSEDVNKMFTIENKNGAVVFKGELVQSSKTGFAHFKNHYLLNFTDIKVSGEYIIKLDGCSQNITINKGAFNYTPDVLLEFMRQQRCGYNPFFDEVCHQHDGRIMDHTFIPDSTYIDMTGGWHDAGDQLKYLITASNATARMIMAYQLFPSVFKDDFNALGQKGKNKIPDVLDEAKWGLDWILKLHPMADVLIHQVADDRDHVGWKYPFDDPSNFGWGKNSYRVGYAVTGKPQGLNKYKSMATGISNLAGRSAAALALGYQVWNTNYDKAFASNCLKSAEELYLMAKSQEGYQQGNSYGAPYRYNEDTWTDDMEWAASELYRATHKPMYLQDAVKYAHLTGELSWIQKDTSAHYQYYPFLNIAHYSLYSQADAFTKKKLATYYKNGIDQSIRQRASKNIYQIGSPFIWCSNNLLVDLGIQIYLYEKMTGDKQYRSYMYAMRDWLFGRNPWGTSMFMNLPAAGIFPHDVHTSTYAKTHREVPGGLVDGPIYLSTYKTQLGLTLTHDDAFAPFQNDYVVYHDDIGDYVTNEPTMDGTACAILFLASFGREK